MELSSLELTTTFRKDITVFCPSNKNKYYLETLVYKQISRQNAKDTQPYLVSYAQALMSGNVSQFTVARNSAWIACRQHLLRQTCAYLLYYV